MARPDCGSERVETRQRGFDEQYYLIRLFEPTLPPVDRARARVSRDTRSQLPIDQIAGDPIGGRLVRTGREYHYR